MSQSEPGMPTAPPVLAGSGLAKNYGATPALRQASLEVARGESVAVMGPSGSGKSTLLYCLAGVVRPDGGKVAFDGVRIDEHSDARRSELRRTEFGFVFQFPGLLPELSADENVALPLMLSGVDRRTAVARARQLFPILGIDDLEKRRPGELSGGEAQRVAIARALIVQPAVVFADEPTGSLDTKAGDDVMTLLVSTLRERQSALVLVTHDERIAQRCDRIIRVVDGRTVPLRRAEG